MKQEIKILKILVAILLILNLGMSLANYKMQIETIALAKENENLKNKVETQQLVITELEENLKGK